MALNKVTYEDSKTVIEARNMNEIQDEIIHNAEDIETLKSQVATLVNATVE